MPQVRCSGAASEGKRQVDGLLDVVEASDWFTGNSGGGFEVGPEGGGKEPVE